MLKKFLCISYVLIIPFSCTEKTLVQSKGSLDWDFFPLEKGTVSIYRIETINYLGRSIPFKMEEIYLKEEIIEQESFEDGSEVFTLLESKQDTTGNWIPFRYFTLRKEFEKAVSIIDNLETVELKLPLQNGLQWEARSTATDCPDGNNFCDYFEVADRDTPFTVEGITYSQTVRVLKQTTLDPLQITKDHQEFVIYAKQNGLVYSEIYNVEYASCRNGVNPDCCCPANELCTLCSGEVEFGVFEKKFLIERIFPN